MPANWCVCLGETRECCVCVCVSATGWEGKLKATIRFSRWLPCFPHTLSLTCSSSPWLDYFLCGSNSLPKLHLMSGCSDAAWKKVKVAKSLCLQHETHLIPDFLIDGRWLHSPQLSCWYPSHASPGLQVNSLPFSRRRGNSKFHCIATNLSSEYH